MAISRGSMTKEMTGNRKRKFGGAAKMAYGGSVKDPKTGETYDKPSYGGASIKGLTSSDPANVARNRAGAAKYSGNSQGGSGSNGNVRQTFGAGAGAAPKMNTIQTRTYNAPPAGYDAGKSGEWNYYTYGTKEVPATGASAAGAAGKTSIIDAISGGGRGLIGAMAKVVAEKKASAAPAKMKAGGKVMRGCGCAVKGTKGKGNI